MKKALITVGSIILAFFIVTTLYTRFGIFTYVVSGESMEPNIHDATVGSGDKLVYKIFGLKRFDIIVVHIEENNWIKRLIGLPNDHLYYHDGVMFINDEVVEERFISNETKISTCAPYYERDEHNQLIQKTPNICQSQGVQLGENEYFFMGDNRSESYDSRRFTVHIQSDDILARVFIRYGVCDAYDYYGNCTNVHYYFPRFLGIFL